MVWGHAALYIIGVEDVSYPSPYKKSTPTGMPFKFFFGTTAYFQ